MLINDDKFFQYAAERQRIFLKRQAGQPSPWTEDPILHKHRFTNIFRENDRVTIWFRENVRNHANSIQSHVFLAVAFRWFNRPETWQTLLNHYGDNTYITSYWEPSGVSQCLTEFGSPPWVTGAYIIKTPNGMNKLEGVIDCINRFYNKNDFSLAQQWQDGRSLQKAWEELVTHYFMGPFMAYEVITDLAHTPVLSEADDIYTWANAGPGAKRGSNRILGRHHNDPINQDACCLVMRELLAKSYDWGWGSSDDTPAWTMREVEHTLCEWDKYERVRLGQGRPRGVYPHPSAKL